jgi:hypothetical protein
VLLRLGCKNTLFIPPPPPPPNAHTERELPSPPPLTNPRRNAKTRTPSLNDNLGRSRQYSRPWHSHTTIVVPSQGPYRAIAPSAPISSIRGPVTRPAAVAPPYTCRSARGMDTNAAHNDSADALTSLLLLGVAAHGASHTASLGSPRAQAVALEMPAALDGAEGHGAEPPPPSKRPRRSDSEDMVALAADVSGEVEGEVEGEVDPESIWGPPAATGEPAQGGGSLTASGRASDHAGSPSPHTHTHHLRRRRPAPAAVVAGNARGVPAGGSGGAGRAKGGPSLPGDSSLAALPSAPTTRRRGTPVADTAAPSDAGLPGEAVAVGRKRSSLLVGRTSARIIRSDTELTRSQVLLHRMLDPGEGGSISEGATPVDESSRHSVSTVDEGGAPESLATAQANGARVLRRTRAGAAGTAAAAGADRPPIEREVHGSSSPARLVPISGDGRKPAVAVGHAPPASPAAHGAGGGASSGESGGDEPPSAEAGVSAAEAAGAGPSRVMPASPALPLPYALCGVTGGYVVPHLQPVPNPLLPVTEPPSTAPRRGRPRKYTDGLDALGNKTVSVRW